MPSAQAEAAHARAHRQAALEELRHLRLHNLSAHAHIGNSQSIQRARAREREREGGREGEGEREGERERAAAEGRQVDRREIVRGRII
jgi:hypothetical protein